MLTYRYKLYSSKRNRNIDAMLREACFVWNHALALQKRYYRLFNGYIGLNTMQKHFAKRISRCRLHSQTVQEILERLDASYQRFYCTCRPDRRSSSAPSSSEASCTSRADSS